MLQLSTIKSQTSSTNQAQLRATKLRLLDKMATSEEIKPYTISTPDSRISQLNDKLSSALFPDELRPSPADSEWDMGAPLSDIQRLTKYWREDFSWRQAEEKLNALPNFTTSIQAEGYEALDIHFLHQKSEVSNAIPLLFAHGWPGNYLEATKIMSALTSHKEGEVSFHVVAPSLPNFGFSQGTKKRGFALEQYAETCHKLMLKLGYTQYVTQGGDWGWYVTRMMSILYPEHCKATHFNMDAGEAPSPLKHPLIYQKSLLHTPTPREEQGEARTKWFNEQGFGYNLLQSTKPQTLGYLLADSPVGLLAWIYEKLHDWTDNYPWTDEEICTWVSIYWFSAAGPAAAERIYYEIGRSGPWGKRMERKEMIQYLDNGVKIGFSHFPRDIHVLPGAWCRTTGDVVFEREHKSGGHFAAWERPEGIIQDLRSMFGKGGAAAGVVEGKHGY